jgi:O-antigen ligase
MALTAERPGAAFAPSPAVRGTSLAAGAIVALAALDGGVAPATWRAGAVVLCAAAALLTLWTPARPSWRSCLPFVPLVAYALLSLASGLWSADRTASLADTQRTLLYVVAAASFVLAGRGLAVGVVVGATAVGSWALGARALDGAPLDPYEGRLLTGPVGYANGLGVLMALGAAVCVALAFRARRPALASPLVVLLPALVLTNSRGSVLALAGGIVVGAAIALERRVAASCVVAASAVLLTMLLVVPPASIGDRAHYWHAALSTAAAHPLAGTGAGTFGSVHVQAPYARDAHSLYLQALSELGIGGLFLAVAVVVAPLVLALRRGLAAPAAGLTVFAVHAGLDWDWQLPVVTVAALALAAAAATAPGAPWPRPTGLVERVARPAARATRRRAA